MTVIVHGLITSAVIGAAAQLAIALEESPRYGLSNFPAYHRTQTVPAAMADDVSVLRASREGRRTVAACDRTLHGKCSASQGLARDPALATRPETH